MIKKSTTILILSTALFTRFAFSADLIEVYQQALSCDPTFKSAEAQYLADKENVPIQRSYLLPNLVLTGVTQRQVIKASTQTTIGSLFSQGTIYNTYNDYILNLSQPIFNYSAWAALSQASYQAKQAEATYAASAQDLMLRTSQAYFNILQASDNLRYTQAQKKAVAEQLRQTQQQYEVGLVAITGVKEAQAKYESLVAEEIAAKNDLSNTLEALRAITDKNYARLMGTSDNLPLARPNPANIQEWMDTAEKQNYSLAAAINAATAAGQNIKVQAGGHLPVVNGTASYEFDHNTQGGVNASGTVGPVETQSGTVGLQLNFPIYQGGLVTAETRQASYLYQQAISQMEYTHRGVIQQARNAYLGVISGINQIKADRQTIVASISSLKATQDGYAAGTRTMLDVLNAQSTLYQAQRAYSQDQYAYLINILKLKEAAGTLGPNDLEEINTWLSQEVNIADKIRDIDLPVIPTPNKKKMIRNNSPEKLPAPEHISSKKSTKKMSEKTQMPGKNQIKNNQGDYFIELFNTNSKAHAIQFIYDYHLESKANYIVMKNNKGETRYQVIYGKYRSFTEAKQAQKNLPANIRKLNPSINKQ